MLILIIGAMMGCEQKLVEEELLSKNVSTDCVEKPVELIICTTQYEPVCGCNNKTYGNSCVAKSMGIKNYTKGECKK
jgi:Kazal-type serine protease inhibitor domain